MKSALVSYEMEQMSGPRDATGADEQVFVKGRGQVWSVYRMRREVVYSILIHVAVGVCRNYFEINVLVMLGICWINCFRLFRLVRWHIVGYLEIINKLCYIRIKTEQRRLHEGRAHTKFYHLKEMWKKS